MDFFKRILKFKNNKKRYKSPTDYNGEPFVIISNNCWGAEIYKDFNQPFNTPFIGLFLFAEDYIKLLEDFDQLVFLPLRFTKKSRWVEKTHYPIGLLNDIEIHFLHYKSENEALAKWARRLKRLKEVDPKYYFFKICDRDGATKDIFNRFHALKYQNKVSFSIYNMDQENHFKVSESENGKNVEDGILLYNVTNKYMDVGNWINTKILKKL